MKKMMLAGMIGALVMAGIVMAEEKAATDTPAKAPAKEITVKGTVECTLDQAGALTSVGIKRGAVETMVVLDDTAKKLAELKGKKVAATGTMVEKDGKKFLQVKEFKAAEEKPAAVAK